MSAEQPGGTTQLAKINFPREALVLSGVYQLLFNGAIKLGILLGVLPFLTVHPGWGGLLIPFGLLSLVLMGTALGLLPTPIGVLYGAVYDQAKSLAAAMFDGVQEVCSVLGEVEEVGRFACSASA